MFSPPRNKGGKAIDPMRAAVPATRPIELPVIVATLQLSWIFEA